MRKEETRFGLKMNKIKSWSLEGCKKQSMTEAEDIVILVRCSMLKNLSEIMMSEPFVRNAGRS